jgi:hypothetical protein
MQANFVQVKERLGISLGLGHGLGLGHHVSLGLGISQGNERQVNGMQGEA